MKNRSSYLLILGGLGLVIYAFFAIQRLDAVGEELRNDYNNDLMAIVDSTVTEIENERYYDRTAERYKTRCTYLHFEYEYEGVTYQDKNTNCSTFYEGDTYTILVYKDDPTTTVDVTELAGASSTVRYLIPATGFLLIFVGAYGLIKKRY